MLKKHCSFTKTRLTKRKSTEKLVLLSLLVGFLYWFLVQLVGSLLLLVLEQGFKGLLFGNGWQGLT